MELAILSVSFLIFLVLGVPVSFALGIACVLTYMVEGLPIATAMQAMISGMNAFSFLAVPFFIFSGELMLHGGIADRILRFAQATVGHFRGGLGMANVVACTLFGGVSGSPTADTSAMGGVVIPLMKREGYSAAYAVNVTTHASLAGALMPTSTNMIIYAFAAQGITGMLHGQPDATAAGTTGGSPTPSAGLPGAGAANRAEAAAPASGRSARSRRRRPRPAANREDRPCNDNP